MVCHIESRRESGQLVVHLAGRLGEAHVADLLEICAAATHPVLELDELVSADAVGVDALLRLEHQGATLEGLPEYLRLKLDGLSRERGD